MKGPGVKGVAPRVAPGKRGGGRGENLTRLRGHSGGMASMNWPGLKGDFQGYSRFPGLFLRITYCTYFTASIGQLKMLTIIQTLLFVLLGSLNCFLESLIQEVNRGDMFSFVK